MSPIVVFLAVLTAFSCLISAYQLAYSDDPSKVNYLRKTAVDLNRNYSNHSGINTTTSNTTTASLVQPLGFSAISNHREYAPPSSLSSYLGTYLGTGTVGPIIVLLVGILIISWALFLNPPPAAEVNIEEQVEDLKEEQVEGRKRERSDERAGGDAWRKLLGFCAVEGC